VVGFKEGGEPNKLTPIKAKVKNA